MTVISIPQQDKDEYCLRYTLKLNTIEDLMDDSGRSRRTVIRMLEEQGITVPRHRRNRKSKTKAAANATSLVVAPAPEYMEEDPFAGLTVEEIYASITPTPLGLIFKNEPEPESKALFMGLINRIKRVFAAVMA